MERKAYILAYSTVLSAQSPYQFAHYRSLAASEPSFAIPAHIAFPFLRKSSMEIFYHI
jgi:hypothetical protein